MTSVDKATLYIVALPIGDIEDLTLKAKRVLESVDVVAAEDTRVFKKLATKVGMKIKRVLSHHNHNETESSSGLIELLGKGQSVAVVSDAGTPGISDPGFRILSEAYKLQIPVVVVPGPSSLTAALSLCPVGGMSHFFGGFAPSRSQDRIKILNSLRGKVDRVVFFESPHRLREHIEDIVLTYGNVQLFVCRELTKPYQETFFGPVTKVQQHFRVHEPRGEFVLIYENPQEENLDQSILEQQIKNYLVLGQSHADIIQNLKDQTNMSRKEIYDLIEKIKKES